MSTSSAPKTSTFLNWTRMRRREERALKRKDEELFNNSTDKRYPKWRKGWPTLPAAPIETQLDGAENLVPDRVDRIKGVREILKNFSIEFKKIFIAFRVPKDRTIKRKEDYLTLVITLDMIPQSHMLDRPLYAVRNRLRNHKHTFRIQIEFVDFRAERQHGLKTFEFRPLDISIHKAWIEHGRNIAPQFLEGQEWLKLELANRGLDEKDAQLTILITSPTAGEDVWWRIVLPDIRAYIKKKGIPFQVELVYRKSVSHIKGQL